MEELSNKLHSKNSTVVALIISKLVEYIQEQYALGEEALTEITFLQNKCIHPEERINEVAIEGLSKLLENGILNPDKFLEELITLIPNTKVSNGLVKAISCTLYHQLNEKKDKYCTKFNLHLPQHPFIILLNKDPEYLQYIYEEMRFPYGSNDMCSLWSSLHYSFYQFCICNPDSKESNFYKMKLWTNLIQISTDTKLITQLISWIPFDTTIAMIVTAEHLHEISILSLEDEININRQVLLILQVSALYHLVSRNYSPRNTLKIIKLLIDHMPIIDFANAILLILAKIIIRSSLVHILEILEICESLISQSKVNVFVLETVEMSLLHWIGNPSSLTSKVVSKAGKIYLFIQDLLNTEREIDNKFPVLYKKYENLITSNQEVYIACKLTMLTNSWKTNNCIFKFLSQLDNMEHEFIKQIIHLVFGIFVSNLNDTELILHAFHVICLNLKNCEEFNYLLLTLILYKISNTSNPKVHFQLLKYLPELARTSENHQRIVTTISALFKSSDVALKTLGMSLMYEVWIITKKSYTHLEDMLTSEVDDKMGNLMEFYINKAYIIKKICENYPQIYGAEMVAHLSRILSKCSMQGELASAIAIDGITVLCNANIIDIDTTWTTLAPKFTEDGRTRTIESLLHLAAAMTNLLHPEHHAKLKEDVIRKVWYYALDKQDLRVKKAAFHALIEFGLENISPYFPEKYLDKTSDGQIDMNNFLIPGHCWIIFLKNQPDLSENGDFLIKMLSKEIDEFPKSVYHVASMKEPLNYSYLPVHSILRGINEYCRIEMSKWRGIYKPVYIESLRILSQEYSKPLPPCNWYYLQELFHEPELKTYCISLASHQVMISGTARRLMENYISELAADSKNEEVVLQICKELKFLANSIQPTILRPFLRNVLNYGKTILKEEHKKEFLNSVVGFLKDALINSNIQDVSKREIVAIINENIESVEVSDEMFDIFVICVIHYPPKFLEEAINLSNRGKMMPIVYKRSFKIRYSLALKPNETLKCMNDLIDVGASNPNLNFSLEEFLNVLKLKIDHSENAQWTSELFGRIEAAVGESNEKGLIFLLDILIVSLVVFSGYYILSDSVFHFPEYMLLFPQSIALLLNIEEWNSYSLKAMECMFYLNVNSKVLIPESYRNIFGQALQALRYHPEFKKNNKWMKYLSSNINFGNYL